MPKAIIILNEHPLEAVALHQARLVAELLRKRGHDVKLEKVPLEQTNYGIVLSARRGTSAREIVKKLAEIPTSIEIANNAASKHDALAFNFHSSEPQVMGEAEKRPPNKFRVRTMPLTDRQAVSPFKCEIAILTGKGKNGHVIEVPGVSDRKLTETTSKDKKQPRSKAIIDEVERLSFEDKNNPSSAFFEVGERYQNLGQNVRKGSNAKYVDRAIAEKIALAIHKRLIAKRKNK